MSTQNMTFALVDRWTLLITPIFIHETKNCVSISYFYYSPLLKILSLCFNNFCAKSHELPLNACDVTLMFSQYQLLVESGNYSKCSCWMFCKLTPGTMPGLYVFRNFIAFICISCGIIIRTLKYFSLGFANIKIKT